MEERKGCMKSFCDLQKEYMGDGTKSYLMLCIPVNAEIKQYQIGMLEKNQIESLLSMNMQRMNDDWKISYDITSKIPLDRVLERKSLKHDEFEYLISQFADLVHVLKDYLLDLSSIVFDKSCIYCEPSQLTLYFLYFPVKTNENGQDNLRSFLKKLIVEDVRLKDDTSGGLLKRVLDVLKSESFSQTMLKQCIDGSGERSQTRSVQPDWKGELCFAMEEAVPERTIPKAGSGVMEDRSEAIMQGTGNMNWGVWREQPQSRNAATNNNRPPEREKTGSKSWIPSQHKTKDHKPGAGVPGMNEKKEKQQFQQKDNMSNRAIDLFRKYPKTSWLIAAASNTVLLVLFVFILASALKKPNNVMSNLLGFLLIASACNYFLFTRLFSKDKIIDCQIIDSETNKRSSTGKHFGHREVDEDIILHGNPILNQKTFSKPTFQKTIISEDGMSGDSSRYHEMASVNDNGFIGETDNSANTISNIQHIENINFETTGKERYSGEEQTHAGKVVDEKEPRINKNTTDNTIILGGPSERVPCLISQLHPADKILLEKTTTLIGRLSDSVDHVIDNKAVGKMHAEIIRRDEKYYIIDLNSVNGTYINGERAVCNIETEIKNGDSIMLANESYRFHM
jgi:hypothetical protein